LWIANPGSVGQPRDGDPRAAVAIASENGITFTRVKYDIEPVLRKLREVIDREDIYARLSLILREGCVQVA